MRSLQRLELPLEQNYQVLWGVYEIRDTSSPFWLVVADCGTTWLFCPQLDSLVKVGFKRSSLYAVSVVAVYPIGKAYMRCLWKTNTTERCLKGYFVFVLRGP